MNYYSPNNQNNRLSFINLNNGEINNHILEDIRNGLWESFDIDAFLFNDTLSQADLHLQKPVFRDFLQIVPGNIWNPNTNSLEQDIYIPQRSKSSFHDFIDVAAMFFDSLNAKRIGVHLSGGLDSSIVICLLSYLKIPFVPIGIRANTFEFRTERFIQNKIIELGQDGLLIDYEECPFYADMDKLPLHPMPTGVIKSYFSNERLAQEYSIRGCDVVISGQGGDTLFVDGCDNVGNVSYNIGYEFELEDAKRMSYEPRNIRLVSFYSYKPIIDIITSAREGEKDDPHKLWARNWCKSILPNELVNFNYIGDFFALSMQGLYDAKSKIRNIFEKAYELTGNKYFSRQNTSRFIATDVFNFEFKSYLKFCGLLAVATWYNSIYMDIKR